MRKHKYLRIYKYTSYLNTCQIKLNFSITFLKPQNLNASRKVFKLSIVILLINSSWLKQTNFIITLFIFQNTSNWKYHLISQIICVNLIYIFSIIFKILKFYIYAVNEILNYMMIRIKVGKTKQKKY